MTKSNADVLVIGVTAGVLLVIMIWMNTVSQVLFYGADCARSSQAVTGMPRRTAASSSGPAGSRPRRP